MKKYLLVFLFFLVETLLFYNLYVVDGPWVYGEDTLSIYNVWRQIGFESFADYPNLELFRKWEPALAYPINFIHFFTDVTTGLGIEIAVHFFIMGISMFVLSYIAVGNSLISSLLIAFLMQFSGPFFAHIYPGHYSNLATTSWIPLIFAMVILSVRKPSGLITLITIPIVCMHLLAGHSQYMYYCGICIVLFYLLYRPFRFKSIWCFMSGYVLAVFLCLFQIYPAYIHLTNGSRFSKDLSYYMSSSFFLPFEYLSTSLYSHAMGDQENFTHVGNGINYWEGNCFFGGVIFIVFLFIGLMDSIRKRSFVLPGLIGFTLIMALGVQTPLYDLCYEYVPFYKNFRGVSKFIFFTIMFSLVVTGFGIDVFVKKYSKT